MRYDVEEVGSIFESSEFRFYGKSLPVRSFTMSDHFCLKIKSGSNINYFRSIALMGEYFESVSHVKYFIHFLVGGLRLFMNDPE
jgi:hypothetical protein